MQAPAVEVPVEAAMPSSAHTTGASCSKPSPSAAVDTPSAAAAAAPGGSLSSLHRALKRVARAVDKLDVHHFLSLRKVIEQKVGKDARISCPDMEALRMCIVHLRLAYGKLEQYLTQWSKRTMGRSRSPDAAPPEDLTEGVQATIVQQAEQLKFEVVAALESLVVEIEKHRSAMDCTGPEAPNAIARFLVHHKYYAALMQHCRSRGLTWLGDVVADYLKGNAAAGNSASSASSSASSGASSSKSDATHQGSDSMQIDGDQCSTSSSEADDDDDEEEEEEDPVVDIADLCCWVSSILRTGETVPSSPRAESIYNEVVQRFGCAQSGQAQTNLFYWLLRMQRVATPVGPGMAEQGHLLDTSVLACRNRHAAVSAAVEEWIWDELDGETGARAWLADAEATGFCTAAPGDESNASSRRSSCSDMAVEKTDPNLVKLREKAIVLHIAFERRAIGGVGVSSPAYDCLTTSRGCLPPPLLRQCVATAARIVKHYLTAELPAKYQSSG